MNRRTLDRCLWFALFLVVCSSAVFGQCPGGDDVTKKNCMRYPMFRQYADNAYVSQGWGVYNPQLYANCGYHAGVDYAAQQNTPFFAVTGGTVVGTVNGVDHTENSYITIYVPNNLGGRPFLHKYGHEGAIYVYPGQHVSAGQILGLVGNRGHTTGYHVHFETEVAGDPYNPNLNYSINDFLSGRYNQKLALRCALSDTSKPSDIVASKRSDGGWFAWNVVPNYIQVTQGQAAQFSVTATPSDYFNVPVSLAALNLPANLDYGQTKWTLPMISGSFSYPTTSTLNIKTTPSTPLGTTWFTILAQGVDGETFSQSVAVNVVPGTNNGGGQSPYDIARTYIQQRAPMDYRFQSPLNNTVFYQDWGTWDAWGMSYRFSGGRFVDLYYVVYKYGGGYRYVGFYDPDANYWRWFPV